MNNLQNIYNSHHSSNRRAGFSVLELQRGQILKSIIGKNKAILDIGCRDGALTKWFSEGNDVLGVDIDNVSLDRAKNNLGIKTQLMDLNGDWAELSGQSFDVIVAGEVVEHLYNPDKLFEKIKLNLKPGGIFIGSVPNAFNLKNRIRYLFANKKGTPLMDPTHINQFSAKELQELLEAAFNEVKIIGLGRYTKLAKMNPSWFAFVLFFVAKV